MKLAWTQVSCDSAAPIEAVQLLKLRLSAVSSCQCRISIFALKFRVVKLVKKQVRSDFERGTCIDIHVSIFEKRNLWFATCGSATWYRCSKYPQICRHDHDTRDQSMRFMPGGPGAARAAKVKRAAHVSKSLQGPLEIIERPNVLVVIPEEPYPSDST